MGIASYYYNTRKNKLGSLFIVRFCLDCVKMLRVVILAVCVSLSVQKSVEQTDDWVKPSFCKGLDCPKYTVLEQFEGYELREYEEAMWVSSEGRAVEAGDITGDLFMKLFYY